MEKAHSSKNPPWKGRDFKEFNLAPEKISILSWNLDCIDDEDLDDRISFVIGHLLWKKYDIIFFQELTPKTFSMICKSLSPTYKGISGAESKDIRYFVGTFLNLSTVYHEDHYIHPYPNSVMGRTVLVTKVSIGKAKLALLNTHLESMRDHSAERIAQLKFCFKISQNFPPNFTVFFGGDLNLRNAEVEGLLPHDMYDIWEKLGSNFWCKYTWDTKYNTNKDMDLDFKPRCRFDRFYFRESFPFTMRPIFFGFTGKEKVEGTDSFPSDHWGIEMSFRLQYKARLL